MIRLIAILCTALWAALSTAGPVAAQDLTAARIETLDRMALSGQGRRAEALLMRLIRTASTPQEAAAYGQALAQIRTRSPLQLRGSFALRPSTNVTRAASATQFSTDIGDFDITGGGTSESGIGATVSLGAVYRLPVSADRTVELTGLLTRDWFSERTLRSISATARGEVVHRRQGETLRYGAFATSTLFDAHEGPETAVPDEVRFGLAGTWSWDKDQVTRTLHGQLHSRNFRHQPARDAGFAQIRMTWSRPLSDRTRLTWGAGLDRLRPRLEYQRYWGAELQAGMTQAVTETLRLGVDARVLWRRYDSDFATVGFARADDIAKLGVSASDSRIRIAGAVPTLACTHTEHRSNIALYQTRYTDCGVTFSFEF